MNSTILEIPQDSEEILRLNNELHDDRCAGPRGTPRCVHWHIDQRLCAMSAGTIKFSMPPQWEESMIDDIADEVKTLIGPESECEKTAGPVGPEQVRRRFRAAVNPDIFQKGSMAEGAREYDR